MQCDVNHRRWPPVYAFQGQTYHGRKKYWKPKNEPATREFSQLIDRLQQDVLLLVNKHESVHAIQVTGSILQTKTIGQRIFSVAGVAYDIITISGEVFAILIIIACFLFIIRRYFIKPKRFNAPEMKPSSKIDATIILGLVFVPHRHRGGRVADRHDDDGGLWVELIGNGNHKGFL